METHEMIPYVYTVESYGGFCQALLVGKFQVF